MAGRNREGLGMMWLSNVVDTAVKLFKSLKTALSTTFLRSPRNDFWLPIHFFGFGLSVILYPALWLTNRAIERETNSFHSAAAATGRCF